MNIKTAKISFATLLVHLMCFTVVLSHMHAKDAASMLSQQATASKFVGTDIPAKALGDLHHHIDKTGLKNVHVDTSATAARSRELNPLEAEQIEDTLGTLLHDFLLRFRVVASLCFQFV